MAYFVESLISVNQVICKPGGIPFTEKQKDFGVQVERILKVAAQAESGLETMLVFEI